MVELIIKMLNDIILLHIYVACFIVLTVIEIPFKLVRAFCAWRKEGQKY